METRNLGSSGLRVSVVGLGCNNFGGRIDLEATRPVVHKAIDLGITLLDTAHIYGNQTTLHQNLQALITHLHESNNSTKKGTREEEIELKHL